MVIFLYGSDRYRLLQNRDVVVQKFKDKHGAISVQTVDGGAGDAPMQLKAALSNNSFFNDIQLVIVRDIFADPDRASKMSDLLTQYDALHDKTRIVVAMHPGPKSAAKQPELLKILMDKDNLVRDFEPLDETHFATWIKKEATDRGTPFAPGAARQFMMLVGSDSWRAINEIEKLSHYCKGNITVEAVNQLVAADQEPEIFSFIDALGARDRNKALSLLYRELSLRQDPYYLLTMVIYQFRTMLMVHDAASRSKNANDIAEETGLKPFVIKKMLPVVARYSAEDLRRVYQALCGMELGAKQGTRDLQDSLYEFALLM